MTALRLTLAHDPDADDAGTVTYTSSEGAITLQLPADAWQRIGQPDEITVRVEGK